MCRNDYTNQRFGRLVALYKGKIDNNGHQYWWFQCDCGTKKEIAMCNVKWGKIQSCGCLHADVEASFGNDLTGQTFHKLTAIKLVSHSPRKWLCKCECGGEAIVDGRALSGGHTKSCGCLTSYGESIINQYLSVHNITFRKEYCVKIEGFKGIPRFDFAIYNENGLSCLIEFHGKQHYEQTVYGSLEQRQYYDLLKRTWAQDNNIPLYEIPYWANIEEELEKIFN